jgi:hypothetical protein
LTPAELCLALAFDFRYSTQKECQASPAFVKNDQDIEKFLRKWSRGLVEVRQIKDSGQPIAQFIHESVREFLLDQNGLHYLEPKLSGRAIGTGNHRLAQACINYLSIQDLPPYENNESIHWGARRSLEKLTESYPFLDYAITFAIKHAAEAERNGIPQDYIVQEFGRGQNHSSNRWLPYYDLNSIGLYKAGHWPGSTLLHLVSHMASIHVSSLY